VNGLKLMYFPGCALKSTAEDYEKTAIAVAEKLGVELLELERWNCCGVVFNVAADAVMHHIAAVRDLIRAQEMGRKLNDNRLVTICSMCYSTLKRVNQIVKDDPEKLRNINEFMDEEEDYEGNIEVIHLLQVFKDLVGYDKIKEKVSRRMEKIKAAPFYGCALLRPKEVSIDDPEDPKIMEELIEALGAEAVKFPYEIKCCSSYNVIYDRKITEETAAEIQRAAERWGANIIVTTCPLCHYNLNTSKRKNGIPTIYFTELMAYAFGLEETLSPETLKIFNKILEEI